MKKMFRYVLLVFVFLMLVACGKPDSQKAFEKNFKQTITDMSKKMKDGKAVANAEIEIEYLNSNIKNSKFVGELQKDKTATVIYADENGYFSFVPVHKGYWGFAALGAGGELKHNGKELSQDAVLWIEAK